MNVLQRQKDIYGPGFLRSWNDLHLTVAFFKVSA